MTEKNMSNPESHDKHGGRRGSFAKRSLRADDEYDTELIDLARVTRVMAGGKRMRFRACIVAGDRKGHVGCGIAKGADVSIAMQKAIAQAKKNLVSVSLVDGTIPHEAHVKFKAARLMLRPARKGRGIIAGGAVRAVLELAGVKDIVSKMHGSSNKINNVTATLRALSSLRRPAPKAGQEADTTADAE